MKHVIIPVFVPHKGCPFDCIYCNQKKISGQVDDMSVAKMQQIIESHISTLDNAASLEIGFFGGSFTGIDKKEQISYLEEANKYISAGMVDGIRLSTRPDYISEEILAYLKEYNVKIIELGVQSLDETILKITCRGHNSENVIKSAKLIKEHGFKLGIQTMIGLPGDSKEKDLETARSVVELCPDLVRIYPTLVIKGTYLEEMMKKGEYTPLTLDEAVEISAELLELYEANNINVIRVGLQPTDTINEGFDVAGGPFHPAFRQLAEARLGYKQIRKIINEKNLSFEKFITIYTGSKKLDSVIGQKRENIIKLKEEYGFNRIEVKTDPSLNKEIIVEKS